MAGPYSAGSVFLQIVPSFRGVPEAIAAEAKAWEKITSQAGADGGKGYSQGFQKEINKGIPDAIDKATKGGEKASGDAGKKAGDSYAGKFESSVQQMKDRLNRDLVSIRGKVDMDDAEATAKLRAIERNVAVLNDSKAEIGVDLQAGTTLAVIDKIQKDLAELQSNATTVDLRVNAAALHEGVDKARIELERLATMTIEPEIKVKQSGAFDRAIKDAVNGALKDLPEYDIKVTGSAAEMEIARIRGELDALSGQTIGIDISDAEAVTKLAELRSSLQQLNAEHWGTQIDVDTLAAKAKLDSLLTTMDELRAKQVSIGTDADTARTDAALIAVADFADRLDGKHAVVHIEVDGATTAVAEIEAVGRAASNSAIGGQDGANAFRAFNGYLLAGATLGPALIPMLAAVGGGAAALGPMAVAGAAGIGVLAMSMSGIGAAVKAMGAAQKSAASDQLAYDKGVQSSTNAMISAQEGLTVARQNAARSSEDAARAVATAVLGEQRAEEQAAQTAKQDNQAVADAIQGVAKAREQAARSAETANRQVEQADRGVATAEQSLQRSQEDAKRAQEDLTRARQDAVKSERDLRLSIEGGAIAYQQALLDVVDAEATLAKVRADPKSTTEQIQRATLALAEQKLQVQELANRNSDMADQQAKWAASGVDGSDQVVAAQQRVQSATESVGSAQQSLADAQRAAADARVQRDQQAADSQRTIADAQRKVADAQAKQAQDQIDSQRNIAQAEQQVSVAREQQSRAAADGQRSISDAQRALAQAQLAYQDSLQKTTGSQRNLNDAMSQLGPAGQDFAKYIFSDLIPAFHQLRDVAAQGFLPGFQSWIDTIVGHYGPQLIQITGEMSGAMGRMFQVFGQTLLTKPFQDLFNMIQNDGPTFIGMMTTVLSNMGSGVASLITAMQPLAYLFGDWLIQASGAFKDWAANLGSSSGLQKFFEYVRQVGPEVADFFKALGGAIVNLVVALAPYGEQLMKVFTSILNFVAGMDPGTLGRIALGIIGIVGAIQGMFAVTAAIKSVESAFNLATVASDKFGFSVGKIASGAALMGGGVAILFQTSQTFRDSVGWLVTTIGDLLGSIQGALPWLGSLGGVLATAAGSFMAFKGIGNILGGIAGAAEQSAPKLGAWVAKLTGSADEGARAAGAMGKLSGVIGGIGGALPYVGVVFGLITTAMAAHTQEIDNMARGYQGWYEAMGEGGSKAAEAAGNIASLQNQLSTLDKQYDASKNSVGGMYIGLQEVNGQYVATVATTEELKNKHDDLATALAKAKQNWDDELAKMGPVERAQALMNQAIAEHGTNSDQARGAVAAYKGAVDANRVSQDNAAWAIDGVNNALIRQNDILIAGSQSELAYQQSVDNLTDAHKRSKDALDQYGPKSDEYRRALLAEQVQALQTAQAAGEHEKSLHQNSSTAVQNSLSQAALYLELERQKSIYGELSPAQEQMRANLERTVTQTDIATVKFDNLGLAVVGVPDDKTIDVASTSPEVEKQLTDLGVHVTHMPDGTVRLTGDTKAAEDLLNATARDRKSTITVVVDDHSAEDIGKTGRGTAGFAYGGYTGPGHRFQPAGIVHAGEFVVPKPIVDSMGVGGVARAVGFPGYASGGLVASLGMPGYDTGGLVANWGGTIDLTGGNVSPLAGMWARAIRDITSLSGTAAQSVGQSFAAMRDGALGATGQLNSGIAGQWGQIAGVINAGAINAQLGATGQFRVLQANADGTFRALNTSLTSSWGSTVQNLNGGSGVLQAATTGQLQVLQANANGIFGQMRVALPANWNAMGDQLNAKTFDTQVRQVGWFTGLRDNLSTLTGQTRDIVTVNWNTMGNNLDWKTGDTSRIVQTTWSTMGANLGQNSRDTVNNVGRAFAGLQPAAQNPVNFVVNTVLNQGLFPAFNAVSSAVSMPNVIQTVAFRPQPTNNTPIYAATGGQVPGYSPTPTADNIPAWLTAGEFVHPVDTVNYYGTDIMDAIRKRKISKEQLAGVRYADGGYVGPRQNYAAGGFTWPELDTIRRKLFPSSVLTSAYRPGANDYHGAGEAIDIGVAGNSQAGLMPIAAALARLYPNSTELIHNPNGSIKNGVPVSPGFWGPATWAAHANHVHWAMTPAALGGAPGGGVGGLGSIFAPMLGGKWGSADEVHSFLANSFAASNAAMTGGPLKNALHGMAPKDLQVGWDGAIGNGVRNWFAQAAAMASAGNAMDPGPIPAGPVRDEVQAVFNAYGWGAGPQWDSSGWLIGKESGWNPRAQNPISTASGLFQQIDGTWASYRPPGAFGFAHMKDASVPLQAAAGAKYIQARYGDPIRARAYWQAHGNYAQGGLVPELHDAGLGGVIHPGLNMIVNKTRKAEASVSMDTIDNLRTIAESGQMPLIGQVTLPIMPTATPDEIAGAIVHAATVAKRGGKW